MGPPHKKPPTFAHYPKQRGMTRKCPLIIYLTVFSPGTEAGMGPTDENEK